MEQGNTCGCCILGKRLCTPNCGVYGGLYNDVPQSVALAPNIAQAVSFSGVQEARCIGLCEQCIVIQTAGDYQVSCMLVCSAAGPVELCAGVRVNGAFTAPLLARVSLGCAAQTVSMTAIVALNAGDVLDLALLSACCGAALFGAGVNASLCVVRLG